MTPLEIDILLHYYTTPVDYRDGDFSAPAVRKAVDEFVADGLLRPTKQKSGGIGPLSYETTERAQVFLQALCALPLPELRWVMPTKTTGEVG